MVFSSKKLTKTVSFFYLYLEGRQMDVAPKTESNIYHCSYNKYNLGAQKKQHQIGKLFKSRNITWRQYYVI